MARTRPSAAELALVVEVEKQGGTVTPTQLERWRQQGWLPRTQEWFNPDSSTLRPDVVLRVAKLADYVRAGRGIGWVGWVFWAADDTADSAARLRAALLKTLRRPFTRAGIEQVPEGDSDAAFQARQEAVARLLKGRQSRRRDLDGTLRAAAAAAQVDLPRSPAHSIPNLRHRAMLELGAQLGVGGVADIGFEGLMEAVERLGVDQTEIDQLRETHRRAQLDGVDMLADDPFFAEGLVGVLQAIETADDQLLCAAVRACTVASSTLWKVLKRARHNPELLLWLMSHVMWDQWVRHSGFVPAGVAGEAALALSTVHFLTDPDWAEDLDRFVQDMHTVLHATHPSRAQRPSP
ncbi:hypothetical protein GCM10017744_103390 [Streptomyces antimycoticus]|uniref:Uncharacterized protein n=1 Tax=Streptomyces antimycoticus TaxID=68175 RepID=A0A4D4KU50_9ACTN|nr:hypothetical protein [Streptomyces antimycoticus]GDY49373.1 hypothetical protein SANT12839_102550 [Streptomyces antimycoticus]